MGLFIVASLCTLLSLSSYVHGAAVVGYPYRSEALGYGPNVVGNSLTHAHGYVRYLDPQGVQHIIGYKYPEPVQQSRRITNEEYLKQLIKGSLNKDEAERSKARDEHFRLWSMNQYDQYRQEIERLKAAGQEPTADLLAKVKTFEDIVIATRRGEGAAAETLQIKQARDEHLRLWNAEAALLRNGQLLEQQQQPIGASIEGAPAPAATPAIHLRFQSAQSDAVPAQVPIIGETAEQQKAREEHLRIYQEQLQHLQQAHAEAAKLAEAAKAAEERSGANVQQAKDARAQYEAHAVEQQQQQAQQGHEVQIVEHFSYIQETPEVQRAKAEHLRLWQEAKQRAENEAKNDNKVNSNDSKLHQHSEAHFATKTNAYKPEQSGFAHQAEQAQQQSYNFAQQDRSKFVAEQKLQEFTDRSDTVTILSAAQGNEKYQEKLYGQQHQQQHQQQTSAAHTEQQITSTIPQLPTPVQDTPEVQRARAEHLRILEELQKQAQVTAEKLAHSRKSSVDAAIPSSAHVQPQHTPIATTNDQSATKSLARVEHQQSGQVYAAVDAGQQSQVQVPVAAVQDTIEVQRAREEHLKLIKEAFTKASEYQATNAAKTSANTNEATLAPYATPIVDRLAEQPINKESAEEARLRIEEAKQREAERLAEEMRLKEEARLQAEDLKRLQLEEQRRQEQERLEQARLEGEKKKDDEHYAERPQLPAGEELPKQTLDEPKQELNELSLKAIQTDGTSQVGAHNKEQNTAGVNANLLRFGGNQVPTTAYYIGAQQQPIAQQQQQSAQHAPGYYYLRDVTNGYLNVDKPYFLQYIPNQQQQLGSKDAYSPADAIPLSSALAALNQIPNYDKPIEKPMAQVIPIASAAGPFSPAPVAFPPASAAITPGSALFAPARTPIIPSAAPLAPVAAPFAPFGSFLPSAPIASISSLAPSPGVMKIDYGSNPSLAALEKATREHFRAHEIALEQLRSANHQQPAQKDCY